MLAAVSPDHMCQTPPPGTAAMQPPALGWALEAWWWPSSMGLGYEHPARGLCQKLLFAPMGIPPRCPASPAWNKDARWSWSPSLFRADLGTTVKKMSVRGCELCTSAFPGLLCSLVASFPQTFQRWLAKLLPHGLKTWLFLIWEINKAVLKTWAFLVQQGGQHRVTRLAFWSCGKDLSSPKPMLPHGAPHRPYCWCPWEGDIRSAFCVGQLPPFCSFSWLSVS